MSNRAFNNTQPISSKIAPQIQQEIINKIVDKYPSIEYLPIGSVGKKKDDDFNGDIDIAIKCKDIKELESIINSVFSDLETLKIESLYIISIDYPYHYQDKTMYVQCDFMIMWDKDYTAFRYYCPDYRKDESKYKVGAKIMFANMILNHCQEKNNNLNNDEIGQFAFRPTALFRYVYKKDLSKYKEQYITNDPIEIAGYAFKDKDISHFNSVETLWEAIHSDNFKYPQEVKELEKNLFRNSFRKGWSYIVPEDFKLEYWDNETIWKIINEQKLIYKINSLGQN